MDSTGGLLRPTTLPPLSDATLTNGTSCRLPKADLDSAPLVTPLAHESGPPSSDASCVSDLSDDPLDGSAGDEKRASKKSGNRMKGFFGKFTKSGRRLTAKDTDTEIPDVDFVGMNITSHPSGKYTAGLLEQDEDVPPRRNSESELRHLAEKVDQVGSTAAEIAVMMNKRDDEICHIDVPPNTLTEDQEVILSPSSSNLSNLSEDADAESNSSNDLDVAMPLYDSKYMVEHLGACPSDDELANVAAVRAKEYINELFSTELSILHRGKWESIAEFTKDELLVGQHLGKGSFSDVFEVTATVLDEGVHTKETFAADKDNLDKMMKDKFTNGPAASPPSAPLSERDSLSASEPVRRGPAKAGRRIMRRATSQLLCPAPAELQITLAMKCLRPQIRSDAKQFIVGVEDLVHETAMLASLDHPNIVKIYGRAAGCMSGSFRLSDGYFILIDRLTDTLDQRIQRWKKTIPGHSPPNVSQVRTAATLADALSYLHSNNIVFRDLKPANVGFNSMGVLKLFDFGFAVGMDEPTMVPVSSLVSKDSRDERLLYEKCGTPRYMAPEVGLVQGYALPADVYSFGILFWEICAMTKPYGRIKSTVEFPRIVFVKCRRPPLPEVWPPVLKKLMTSCWTPVVSDRPEMPHVKSVLTAHVRDLTRNPQRQKPKRGMLRRLTSSSEMARSAKELLESGLSHH